MAENTFKISLFRRAMGLLRSRRLKRFTGTDLSIIENKVACYYASQSGEGYYARLAEQNIWDDMDQRKDFTFHCESATDILDFGCGAGGLSVALSQHYPQKQIHALDIGLHAAALINQTKSKVSFQQGSVLDAPLHDSSMDMIVSRFVIEHTIHPDKLIAEAYRMLRPNGIMYLLYPQLLLKVPVSVIIREVFSWLFLSRKLTYLDPQIGTTTSDADDQDAVWLTNPVKIKQILKAHGFKIVRSVPTQSLVIARKF